MNVSLAGALNQDDRPRNEVQGHHKEVDKFDKMVEKTAAKEAKMSETQAAKQRENYENNKQDHTMHNGLSGNAGYGQSENDEATDFGSMLTGMPSAQLEEDQLATR